jgi:hypothetical protein
MNPDTQGTTNRISFLKKTFHLTPHGTNNLAHKQLNHKSTTTIMIVQ